MADFEASTTPEVPEENTEACHASLHYDRDVKRVFPVYV